MADLRLTFDRVPEIYDRARPGYPDALFVDLLSYVREALPSAVPRVLEIGPGTGQATRSLLEMGAYVTAVEIGPNLARFLREKFSDEPRLEVVHAAFEDAELPAGAFDLVVSATAFGWLDPGVRLVKPRRLLRPGGVLAVISANQVRSDADRGFFDRTFPVYKRHRPDEREREAPGPDVVPPEYEEVRSSGLFEDVSLWRYPWDQRYETAAYADLIRSYSNSQAMEPAAMESLIAELCSIIDAEYDGYVVRPLVVTLTAGRRAK